MYKVVRVRGDKLLSAWVDGIDSLSQIYKIGQWTYPKLNGTKLFVFNDLDNARTFISNIDCMQSYRLQIYQCHVLNPVYEYDKFINSLYRLVCIIRDYNEETTLKEMREYSTPCSYKSVYCDAVKLFGEPIK